MGGVKNANEIITIEESEQQAVTPIIGVGSDNGTIPRSQEDDSKLANIEVPGSVVPNQ